MAEPRALSRYNVALIGFMACGKTTVGRRLAAALGYNFVDVDEAIVAAAGCDIPTLFDQGGEALFRRWERDTVAWLSHQHGQVLACGGGVVNDPANVAALRAGGPVVLLRIGADAAAERLLADGPGRPMIDDHVAARTPAQVTKRVRELLAERAPRYAAAADVVVDVDGQSVDEVVAAVQAALLSWQADEGEQNGSGSG